MNEEAISEYLEKTGENWEIIEKLVQEEKLTKSMYNGMVFYLRKMK